MRKFTQKISIDELKQKVMDVLRNNPDLCGYPDSNSIEKMYPSTGRISETIRKDVEKVDFSEESFECFCGSGFFGTDKITGFQTLPNGLTYWGCVAGGDWEHAVFYIVYWDGKKLRGYVPKEGNLWNTEKNSAYGNNEESDDEDAIRRFGVPVNQLYKMDIDAILKDIKEHIVYSNAEDKEEEAIINPLAEYTNEELLAEIAKRMKV